MDYLFGPVQSRRLGISLGVDLFSDKVCNLNCIYCEVGKTNKLQTKIKDYSDLKLILKELDEYLLNKPKLDYITITGSGEPTLHSGLGEIISHIKSNYPEYKICVITNSTLLWKDEIKNALAKVDLVMPSLDAANESVFRKINAPHSSLNIEQIINGLISFANEFRGKIWLEVFISVDINDNDQEVKDISKIIKKIRHDRVQLNSLDRPGRVANLKKVSYEKMVQIQNWLKGFGINHVEIIGKYINDKQEKPNFTFDEKSLIATLKRRPQTLDDLLEIFQISKEDVISKLKFLIDEKKIISEFKDREIYYHSREI